MAGPMLITPGGLSPISLPKLATLKPVKQRSCGYGCGYGYGYRFVRSSSLPVDLRLRDAAQHTVDYFVRNGMVIGLGTGPASKAAISYIGQKIKSGALQDVMGTPMSSFSASEAAKAGVPLVSFDEKLKLDFAFDDVDLVQEGTLFAVIGRKGIDGRESIIKEKGMARSAGQFVFIVDETNFTQQLEGTIPVIIEQANWMETAEEIDDTFLGDAEVWRRPTFGEASPLGGEFPLITAEGYFVLDIIFTAPISDPVFVARSLNAIDGVVDHGLVLDAAYAAAVGCSDGVKLRTSLFKDAFTSM